MEQNKRAKQRRLPKKNDETKIRANIAIAVSHEQREELYARAEASGAESVSEYARRVLFPDWETVRINVVKVERKEEVNSNVR